MSDVVECLVCDKNSYLEQLTAVWWAASQEYVCLVVLLENIYTKSCFEGECKYEMGFGANNICHQYFEGKCNFTMKV